MTQFCRHPELVSGSTPTPTTHVPSASTEGWMLKQVQHDGDAL